MELLTVDQQTRTQTLLDMQGKLRKKYVIITDWEEHFYISHPEDDFFMKLRGLLYMNRNFLPSMIDFEDGWQILHTDNLEEAIESFHNKFKDQF